MSTHGNLTGNFSIDQYKEHQYINGNVTIHSKLLVDKVSETILNSPRDLPAGSYLGTYVKKYH